MNYEYTIIDPMCYDEWADASYEAERIPLLPRDKAERLHNLYNHEGRYTETMHRKNINWLENLQDDIYFVWSFVQRENSGMLHLVEDYKSHYEL
ncbi:MAG: hypothetical protein RR394_09945 [Oscillospiraceae bacterium]